MQKINKLLLISAALTALTASTAAQAQVAGSWLVRAGGTMLRPNVTSGDLTTPSLPSTQIGVSNASQLSGGISYMLTDNVAVDLPVALPFSHDITGANAIGGVGKIGSVKALPATLTLQWRAMEANSLIRPYVGLGVTYAKFFEARGTSTLTAITGGTPNKPTTIEVESKWIPTVQLGLTYALDKKWFLDAHMTYSPLSTRTTLSTGQTIDATLNPTTFSLAVGMMF